MRIRERETPVPRAHCHSCHGEGEVIIDPHGVERVKCPTCKGSGATAGRRRRVRRIRWSARWMKHQSF